MGVKLGQCHCGWYISWSKHVLCSSRYVCLLCLTASMNLSLFRWCRGTGLAYFPRTTIDAIFQNVSGSKLLSDGVTTEVPCDSAINLGLTFGSRTYLLNKNDSIVQEDAGGCTSAFLVGDPNQVMLGDIFCKPSYRSDRTAWLTSINCSLCCQP